MDETEHVDRLQQAAEEVRSHLVVLRGGAPFLSPLDGRLLMEWLEAGIGVPAILRALEQAAAKRRERRIKTPLSLRSVRARVARSGKLRVPDSPQGLAGLVEALSGSTDPLVREAAAELAGLRGSGEPLLREALHVVRWFHEQDWSRADREALLEQAAGELGDLRASCDDKQWSAAVEAVARDQLRSAHPLLSATAVWDSLEV